MHHQHVPSEIIPPCYITFNGYSVTTSTGTVVTRAGCCQKLIIAAAVLGLALIHPTGILTIALNDCTALPASSLEKEL